MSPSNTKLDELRRQIDGLDDRIHDLLIERSAMIEQIIAAKGDGQPKLRPGREAEIARRIVGRHQGHFPAPSLVRIWREIINAFTCMQGPFSIALSGAPEDRRIRELARDHFGGTPERVIVEDTNAALRAVAEGDVTLAVLPYGERGWEWFGDMVGARESGLRICFGLPFVRANAGVETAAVAVGRVDSEPTDDDISVVGICVPDSNGVNQQKVKAAVRAAGFEPLTFEATDLGSLPGEAESFATLELAGRLDPEAMDRLHFAVVEKSMLVVPLGAYAAPIILSSEE